MGNLKKGLKTAKIPFAAWAIIAFGTSKLTHLRIKIRAHH